MWCDYLNFVQEHEPSVRECSPAGVLKARNLFERALTAAGLHVTEGYKIWEAYREFELAIFYVIDETAVEVRTPFPLLVFLYAIQFIELIYLMFARVLSVCKKVLVTFISVRGNPTALG